MVVPINIDLSDLVEEFDLSQDQSTFLGASIIDAVITEYQLRWENLINRELRTTRNEYKRGVFFEKYILIDNSLCDDCRSRIFFSIKVKQ